jgi:hypothetical protein
MLIRTLCLLPLLAANLDYCSAQTEPPANDWVAFKACRERLQAGLDAGEMTKESYSDRVQRECNDHLASFTPAITEPPKPPTPVGTGTR